MYCSNCGTDVNQARYCQQCGTAQNPDNGSASRSLFPAPLPTVEATQHSSYVDLGSEITTWNPPKVSFGEAISAGFRGYVVWNARSTRAEYWWWTLFNALVVVGALIIDSLLTGGLLYILTVLGFIIPNISIFVRRLHDLDRSGWWFWLSFVPLVGPIVLLVFLLTPSERRATRWNRSLILDR